MKDVGNHKMLACDATVLCLNKATRIFISCCLSYNKNFFGGSMVSWKDGVLSSVAGALISGGIALVGDEHWFYGVLVVFVGVLGFFAIYIRGLRGELIEKDRVMIASGKIDFQEIERMLGTIVDGHYYDGCVSNIDYLCTEFLKPRKRFLDGKTARLYRLMCDSYDPLSDFIGRNFFREYGKNRLWPDLNSDLNSVPKGREGEYGMFVKELNSVYFPFRKNYDKFVERLHGLGHI